MYTETFPAMGTTFTVSLWTEKEYPPVATESVMNRIRMRVNLLEEKWSRFQPDSEISALNKLRTVPISEDTVGLIERMKEAWVLSEGFFNPGMGSNINALGYDKTFALIHDRPDGIANVPISHPVGPDLSRVTVNLDPVEGYVAHLPDGVNLDPGGIGKGYAADVIVKELTETYKTFSGIMINAGGDIVVAGNPNGNTWVMDVEDGLTIMSENWDGENGSLGWLEFPAIDIHETVSVCTSTVLKRAWREGTHTRHHILDPRTGLPSTSGLVQVTTVAESGWLGEAAAKTILLANNIETAPKIANRIRGFVALRENGTVEMSEFDNVNLIRI